MNHTATYSPEDNKIRIYPAQRLNKDDFYKLKAEGFHWAPKQELFVAPAWTPSREDIAIEFCGEIEDEDKSLVDRAGERASRFEELSQKRKKDSENASESAHSISERFAGGQPTLVGHHSEKGARKDRERVHNAMAKSVKTWEQAIYWKARATAAIRHAKYKELPAVRARRIKGLVADQKKQERTIEAAISAIEQWSSCSNDKEASSIANYCHIHRCFPLDKYPRDHSTYEGQMSLWQALDKLIINYEQAKEIAIPSYKKTLEYATRWENHLANRLVYERAMLQATGGTITDQKKPEVGGAVRYCGKQWAYIQKVNKVSLNIIANTDPLGSRGKDYNCIIQLTKIKEVMSASEVAEAKNKDLIVEIGVRGFLLKNI
jgi:hypothetical protein